mmetsp:Transcript_77291/g.205136  ORF Transcript_77291/g.205136 Transcript_77291/m.205136 type:complete len:207 (+) Transcript_77291:1906-2526(+)
MRHASMSWAMWSALSISNTQAPTPSPRRKPLADSSKVKDRPPIETICAEQYAKKVQGESTRSIPMTKDVSKPVQAVGFRSPLFGFRIPLIASPIATKAEEQAVSMSVTGPFMFSAYDRRAAVTPELKPLWPQVGISMPFMASSAIFPGTADFRSVFLSPMYTPTGAPHRLSLVNPDWYRDSMPISIRLRWPGPMCCASSSVRLKCL